MKHLAELSQFVEAGLDQNGDKRGADGTARRASARSVYAASAPAYANLLRLPFGGRGTSPAPKGSAAWQLTSFCGASSPTGRHDAIPLCGLHPEPQSV
jgi:hypothetical protein